MAERRKPCFIFLLRIHGKKKSIKIELFHAIQWKAKADYWWLLRHKYRIRLNGKWWNDKEGKMIFLSKYGFRDVLWRSIKKMF